MVSPLLPPVFLPVPGKNPQLTFLKTLNRSILQTRNEYFDFCLEIYSHTQSDPIVSLHSEASELPFTATDAMEAFLPKSTKTNSSHVAATAPRVKREGSADKYVPFKLLSFLPINEFLLDFNLTFYSSM